MDLKPVRWRISIPEEGRWPVPGKHADYASARASYLKWAKRRRLPAGAAIRPGRA
jgi:hypothetical protein